MDGLMGGWMGVAVWVGVRVWRSPKLFSIALGNRSPIATAVREVLIILSRVGACSVVKCM